MGPDDLVPGSPLRNRVLSSSHSRAAERPSQAPRASSATGISDTRPQGFLPDPLRRFRALRSTAAPLQAAISRGCVRQLLPASSSHEIRADRVTGSGAFRQPEQARKGSAIQPVRNDLSRLAADCAHLPFVATPATLWSLLLRAAGELKRKPADPLRPPSGT
jgi:hypothetical protein